MTCDATGRPPPRYGSARRRRPGTSQGDLRPLRVFYLFKPTGRRSLRPALPAARRPAPDRSRTAAGGSVTTIVVDATGPGDTDVSAAFTTTLRSSERARCTSPCGPGVSTPATPVAASPRRPPTGPVQGAPSTSSTVLRSPTRRIAATVPVEYRESAAARSKNLYRPARSRLTIYAMPRSAVCSGQRPSPTIRSRSSCTRQCVPIIVEGHVCRARRDASFWYGRTIARCHDDGHRGWSRLRSSARRPPTLRAIATPRPGRPR